MENFKIIKRKKKVSFLEENKDKKYYHYRKINTLGDKKCRENKKILDKLKLDYLSLLEEQKNIRIKKVNLLTYLQNNYLKLINE